MNAERRHLSTVRKGKSLPFRWRALVAFALIILPSTQIAARGGERVWNAISARHPTIASSANTRRFVLSYVTALEPFIGPLDNFVDLLEGRQSHICNLLCLERVTGAFRARAETSAADLVRYVFTATCFGFVPDDNHVGKALAQLDGLLKLDPKALEPMSPADRALLRELLGDTIKSWEKITSMDKTRFKGVLRLWKEALGPNINPGVMRQMPPEIEAAAKEACRSSLVPTRI
jgi:hypothetical protein